MTATSNTPLNVPFKEKDEAKALGARWNPDAKHWYVPEGVDAAPFEKWLTGAPTQASTPPQAVAQAKPQTTTTHAKKHDNTLPTGADMDDINAMLRDAYEVNDAQ